ncbi:MAG: TrkA family potassium uptake protein, partial [Campylobacterota bacterium]|nr:TrkA family potassium uptake protein [Campylobacterota bacterium]
YDGVYLKDIDFKNKDEIIILGIQDKEIGDNFIFYSSGINHKIDAGDTIVILGIKEDLISFNKNINTK